MNWLWGSWVSVVRWPLISKLVLRPKPTPLTGSSRTSDQTLLIAFLRQLALVSVLGLAVRRSASVGNSVGSAFGTRRATRTRNGAHNGRKAAARSRARRKPRRANGTRRPTSANVVRWKVFTRAKVARDRKS